MAQHQYIQLPPDSTGKKLMHRIEVVLNYKNGTVDFNLGDAVTGATSGVNGDITYISGTTDNGELHVLLSLQSATAFIDGEDLEVNSVKYAEANGVGLPNYIPLTMLTSSENTNNVAIIDSAGSLQMKFKTGDPAVDITGRQEVVSPITIGEYNFKYDKQSDVISEVIDGTASSTYLPLYSSVRMRVETSSGDRVTKTTNPYHITPDGVAFGCILALWIGDTGKENCRRRWGYFDEGDGYFFELNGTTLNVVERSSVTGSLIETRIAQDDWNIDKLDGSGGDYNKSGVLLDVSKTNAYYLQMTGAGDGCIFGVYVDGARVQVHAIVFANYFSGTAIGKSSQLPLRWEIENTGTTASTSEMYILSGEVLANTTAEGLYSNRKGLGSLYTEAVPVDSDWTHMFSIRAAKTYQGKDNRAWIYPFLTTFLSDTAPVVYGVRFFSTIEGGTWVQQGLAEYNIDATSASGGVTLAYDMAGPNEVVKCNHLEQGINPGEAKLIRYADIDQDPMVVSVFCKSLGASTNVTMSFTWQELY